MFLWKPEFLTGILDLDACLFFLAADFKSLLSDLSSLSNITLLSCFIIKLYFYGYYIYQQDGNNPSKFCALGQAGFPR